MITVKKNEIVDGTRVCNKCEQLLSIDSFYKRKDGYLYTACKKCKLEQNKKKYYLNPKQYKEYKKRWKKANKEKIKMSRKLYREKLKIKRQKINEEKKIEKLRIKEEIILNKIKRKEEREKLRVEKERLKLEKERLKLEKEKYYKSEEYLNKKRESQMIQFRKKMSNPLFKFRKYIQNNIRNSFKRGGFSKTSKTKELLGADWSVVKEHFEKKFKDGMSWNNQGEWHIDHIVPLSTATSNEDIIRLNHYTNLQPLWAEDNINKSNKLINF